jgi:uncharacterized protein YecE (DUF72 family)
MTIRVGTSGWSYPHFRRVFYPEGLPARRELAFASRAFDSLEINRSFYSLLSPDTYLDWAAQTPERFVFSLKGGNFITHSKKLRDVETPLANFFASGPLALGPKLGPVVWQLPETLAFDEPRVEAFFGLLPRSTQQAAELARKHDHRLKRGAFTGPVRQRRLRHAVEPRHESFLSPAFARLARRHGVAIVVADSAAWPCIEQVTAPFVYLRLHGHEETYRSPYGRAELECWAQRVRCWSEGREPRDARRIDAGPRGPGRPRDVYVYFDNDAHGHAAQNAGELRALLGKAG